jgi:hypothetical protein
MMSKTEKKCWSESFGVYGSTIRVSEREPGGILYLLWIDKTGKQRKRSLGHRDRKRGKKEALALANQLANARASMVTAPEAEPLTLAEGIERAFDPLEGMYPVQTRHALEGRKLASRGATILGRDTTWAELTAGKIQSLVRVLARDSEQGRGARTAEYMCDMLYTVAAWLRQEELIPDTAALPKRNWKVRLKQEWKALTGHQVQPKRPRHTVEEVSALFRALPEADPRLRLLVELAAELRAGQAVRARRSDLVLEPVGGFGLGRFIVHGNGKKHGEVVDLHPELRALVDETLATGYLSDAEIAYRWEETPDYYLFPAGRLRRGKVRVDLAKAGYIGPTAIRDMFRALEKLAGVEHQPGRSLYGLRRQATDLAPEFAQDARVLNRLSGHLDSATRERIYQDPMNEVVLARAAKARQQMRKYVRDQNGNGNEADQPPQADLSQTYPRVIPPTPESEKPRQRKRRQGFRLT